LEYTNRRAILVLSRDGFILWARPNAPAFQSRAFIGTKNLVRFCDLAPAPQFSTALLGSNGEHLRRRWLTCVSDLNQRQYCEAQGIPLKAFGNWRAKFKAEPRRLTSQLELPEIRFQPAGRPTLSVN
jgi:hypothetical protein